MILGLKIAQPDQRESPWETSIMDHPESQNWIKGKLIGFPDDIHWYEGVLKWGIPKAIGLNTKIVWDCRMLDDLVVPLF